MNREQAKQLLPIIQAFAEGANVQFNDGHEWNDCRDPTFYCLAEWRIKPKPLERWVVFDCEGNCRGPLGGYHTQAGAESYIKDCAALHCESQPYRIVHLCEVTP